LENRGAQIGRAPVSFLTENIFHPTAGLGVTDSSEISLSGRKIGVPEDDLADDLDRRPGPAGISSRMAPKIMRADFKTDFSARFFDNLLGAGVAQLTKDGSEEFLIKLKRVFNRIYLKRLVDCFCPSASWVKN